MTHNDITNCRLLLVFLKASFRGATIGQLRMDDLIRSLEAVIDGVAAQEYTETIKGGGSDE